MEVEIIDPKELKKKLSEGRPRAASIGILMMAAFEAGKDIPEDSLPPGLSDIVEPLRDVFPNIKVVTLGGGAEA